MAGKLTYERFYWFHGQIISNHHPNARTLARRFEISPKQAQRDIEFMRTRLDAPQKMKNIYPHLEINETQATGISMHRDELELASRIIPKAKCRGN